jgi:hypothetical protein
MISSSFHSSLEPFAVVACVLLLLVASKAFGYSRWALFLGMFPFGAAVWWLYGIVEPEHRVWVLPGALFWPFMVPAGAACLLWSKIRPQPSRLIAVGYVVMALTLGISGFVAAYLISGIV